MDSNLKVIKSAMNSFRNQIDAEVTKRLNLLCRNILTGAIRARLSQQRGHDYTGNLLNSIVVVLYDEGAISTVLTSGKDGMIRQPISGKMYARKKPFYFPKDYSGRSQSHYIADVTTNRGYADEDIERFLAENNPSFTNGYCITVAYTVEYADWIESQRQTTGYLESQKYAGRQLRMHFVPLTRSN